MNCRRYAVNDFSDLAEAIAARRQALGLSRRDLSRLTDVPEKILKAIERGSQALHEETTPPIFAVLKLRLVLRPTREAKSS